MKGFEELDIPIEASMRARRLSKAAAWEMIPAEEGAGAGESVAASAGFVG